MHAAVISLVFAAMAGAAADPPMEPAPSPDRVQPDLVQAQKPAPPPEHSQPPDRTQPLERAQPDAGLAFGVKDVPLDILEQALAPAPRVVILKTAYYGVIAVNHAAHLARKIHCIECHGPGPVTHIEFTPKIAHERCRNCHAEAKRGPTECRGCHNMVAPGTVVTGMRAIGAPEVTAAQAKAMAEAKAAEEARQHATAGAIPTAAELHAFAEADMPAAIYRTVQVGGAAGDGYGFSVRVASRQDWLAISHNLDRMTGPGRARTLIYSGGGGFIPLQAIPSLGLLGEVVGGVDAVQRPRITLSAALGARVGVEWAPPFSPRYPITLSVAGFTDLFRDGVLSPAAAFVTLGVGAPLLAN